MGPALEFSQEGETREIFIVDLSNLKDIIGTDFHAITFSLAGIAIYYGAIRSGFCPAPLRVCPGVVRRAWLSLYSIEVDYLRNHQMLHVQLVIETEDTLENFKAVFAEVLLLGGSKSQSFLRIALDGLSTVLPKFQRIGN